MTQQNEFDVPIKKPIPGHLTYSFLKMYFEQEKYPNQLSIPSKKIFIPDVKKLVLTYIKSTDFLIKNDADLKTNRLAETNKHWLVKIYNEIQRQKPIKPVNSGI